MPLLGMQNAKESKTEEECGHHECCGCTDTTRNCSLHIRNRLVLQISFLSDDLARWNGHSRFEGGGIPRNQYAVM
jgi:hypothetical protein